MSRPAVRLRPIRTGDWQAVHSWARLDEASRFQVWGPNTPEETRAFVEQAVADWSREPRSRLSFVSLLDETVVGAGELKLRNLQQRQGEISYIVHPDHWGRGIGTAIGRELLRIGFGDEEPYRLHRIYATCEPRNAGSARILSRLGLRYEGRMRHTAYLADGWRDSELYAILEDEWRATR